MPAVQFDPGAAVQAVQTEIKESEERAGMTIANVRINRLERLSATILAIAMLTVIGWFAMEMAGRGKDNSNNNVHAAYAAAQDEPEKPKTSSPTSSPRSGDGNGGGISLPMKGKSADPVMPKTPASPTAPATATALATVPAPAPPVVYTPTPDESKDLRIVQLEAINVKQIWDSESLKLPEYQAWQDATKRLASYQTAVEGLNRLGAACQKVKDGHKWPAEVRCNPDTNPVTFVGQTIPMKP